MQPDEFARLHGYYFEQLDIGMSAEMSKVIKEPDLAAFVALSGDDNPLHLNEQFAARTRVGGRVVHGMVTASLISTLVGCRLPGPGCLWMSQTLAFRHPVRLGDEVRAKATITGLDSAGQRATLRTECAVDGTVVIEGEAVMWVPSASSR